MEESFDFMHGMTMRQFLLGTLRGLLPSLLLNIAGTIIIYNLLIPHFPPASIVPLLVASLVPVLGNIISVLRHRRLDIFGIMMLIGLAVSGISILLGGGPQLLLIRESFVSGAVGLALLVSMVLPRSLGYYFARQFLTANDPRRMTEFQLLCQMPFFRTFLQGGTVFWGILMLGEFIVRVVLVFTLPVVLVLAIAPIVSNVFIIGGIIVSMLWVRRVVSRIRAMRPAAGEPAKEQNHAYK
jgi:hypothetical protein